MFASFEISSLNEENKEVLLLYFRYPGKHLIVEPVTAATSCGIITVFGWTVASATPTTDGSSLVSFLA